MVVSKGPIFQPDVELFWFQIYCYNAYLETLNSQSQTISTAFFYD
jgi:hypothetical protein